MEWVALGIWLLVLLTAFPLSLGVVYGRLSLAVQALAAGAGFALVVVFIVLDGTSWPAWTAVGVAVLGLLAVLIAVADLTSDREHAVAPASDWVEQAEALLAGAQLPLFGVAALLTMVAAFGIGTTH